MRQEAGRIVALAAGHASRVLEPPARPIHGHRGRERLRDTGYGIRAYQRLKRNAPKFRIRNDVPNEYWRPTSAERQFLLEPNSMERMSWLTAEGVRLKSRPISLTPALASFHIR